MLKQTMVITYKDFQVWVWKQNKSVKHICADLDILPASYYYYLKMARERPDKYITYALKQKFQRRKEKAR